MYLLLPLLFGFILILSACQTVPNNAISVTDITRNTITETVDLEPAQIEIDNNNIVIDDDNITNNNQTHNTDTSEYFKIDESSIDKSDTIDNNFKTKVIPNNNKLGTSESADYSLKKDKTATKKNQIDTNNFYDKNIAGAIRRSIADKNKSRVGIDNTAKQHRAKRLKDKNFNANYNQIALVIHKSGPANILLNKANIAIADADYKKANAILDRALSIAPDEPKLWHTKAKVLLFLKNYRQAKNLALRSNSLHPSSSVIDLNLQIISDAERLLDN